jgi:hypothetical protein
MIYTILAIMLSKIKEKGVGRKIENDGMFRM